MGTYLHTAQSMFQNLCKHENLSFCGLHILHTRPRWRAMSDRRSLHGLQLFLVCYDTIQPPRPPLSDKEEEEDRVFF